MKSKPTLLRSILLPVTALVLSACQNDATSNSATDSSSNSSVEFSAPSRILQVRSVDRDNLRPEVMLSTGQSVEMERTDDNTWTGSINIAPNNSYFITLTWIESLPQGNLVLAEWDDTLNIGNDSRDIFLGVDDYDYSADFDGDNVTNIQEREANTDPFVANGEPATDSDNQDNGDTPIGPDSDNDADSDSEITDIDGETDTEDEDADSDAETPDTDNEDESTDADTDEEDSNEEDDQDNKEQATTPTVIIPRIDISDAPIIDGLGVRANGQSRLIGEWADAVQIDIDGVGLLINNLMVDVDADSADGAPLRSWAAMHDGINLYLLALVDDIGARHGDSNDIFEDDALELFIDADNSKLPAWGDADDFHYMIPLLIQDSNEANNSDDGRIQPGPMSSPVELDIVFHTGPGDGPDGIRIARFEQDVYELAIPLADAGIQVGQAFGLELQIDDDDNGGGRESKWGWFHPSRQNGVDTDTTYTNPSIMGTVILDN